MLIWTVFEAALDRLERQGAKWTLYVSGLVCMVLWWHDRTLSPVGLAVGMVCGAGLLGLVQGWIKRRRERREAQVRPPEPE